MLHNPVSGFLLVPISSVEYLLYNPNVGMIVRIGFSGMKDREMTHKENQVSIHAKAPFICSSCYILLKRPF